MDRTVPGCCGKTAKPKALGSKASSQSVAVVESRVFLIMVKSSQIKEQVQWQKKSITNEQWKCAWYLFLWQKQVEFCTKQGQGERSKNAESIWLVSLEQTPWRDIKHCRATHPGQRPADGSPGTRNI
uniref:Uncharacterized protein n=1 Tax=Entomoneis paludosa TaxID=265537 RepID=A0A7S2Y462_9STRA|mmetsp:Transcript_15245/g.31444  ORF Transcript_15245/g.31444 Transcript_15245/m.31444 type:complete len:127 (+) Transcript_15245:876-1256(+)